MTIYTIPRANAPIAGSEAPTIQWYNYLNYLASQTSPSDLQAQIDVLSAEIAKIPGGFNLKTIDSIAMTGNSGVGGLVQLSLVGDVSAPSALSFYGSVPSNDAGWYTFSSNFADNAGALDLSQPTIGSGGTLSLLGFDAYGRLSETAAASTTNLAEGTNLYFTNARAQDATGLAIAAGTQTGITVTYNSGSHSIDFTVAPSEFATKSPVAYAATAALPSNTYSNGTSGVGATLTGTANGPLVIDGVTLVTGSAGLRVLVTAESTSSNNGWYVVTQVGVVAVSPYILTRSTDADTGAEIGPGYLTVIEAPSTITPGTNNGKVFISIAPSPFVVGTDTLLFSAVGSAGGVSSVFGRTGTVVAASGDYIFAQIGSTPTTRAGYGITDAQPLAVRSTVAVTSSSGAAQNGTITMGKQVTLLNLSSNAPLRIRLYTTVAAQTADQSRGVAAYPAPGSGLLFEGVTTATLTAFDISSADAFNNESTVTTAIAYRLEPATAVSTTATFTFTVTQS